MKIFNFALLGLINAQAPSPQKDCTDCLNFADAYKDIVKTNPGIIDQWCDMAEGECSGLPSASQGMCKSLASKALHKYLNKVNGEDNQTWCKSITMCPNTKAFFGTTTPKDCAACNAFMTDLSLIAQYDPSHFKQIFGALSSQICAELGGFEAKICVGEVKNFEENVRNALIGADSEQICEAIMFC